jgi:hypothetical protein
MADWLRALGSRLKRILRIVLGIALAIPFFGLFAMMFLLPPVATIWESIDMLRMHSTVDGQVTNVTFERGSKGTSRARIEYSYIVDGRQFVSDRYLPGFAGNSGSWTGGAAVANDFPVGRAVTIHYRPADPATCALEYGWFKWSLAPSAVWMGLAIIAWSCSRMRSGTVASGLWGIGIAFVAYGAGELFVGPSAVRVADLHWHALAWCGAVAGAAVFAWCKKRFPGPADDPLGDLQTAESTEESADVTDREHSTPYLVFELLFVISLLTIIVLSSYEGVLTFGPAAIRGLFAGMANASEVIGTILAFILIGVTITIYVGLLCAVVSCFRKVMRRIAWHRRRSGQAA